MAAIDPASEDMNTGRVAGLGKNGKNDGADKAPPRDGWYDNAVELAFMSAAGVAADVVTKTKSKGPAGQIAGVAADAVKATPRVPAMTSGVVAGFALPVIAGAGVIALARHNLQAADDGRMANAARVHQLREQQGLSHREVQAFRRGKAAAEAWAEIDGFELPQGAADAAGREAVKLFRQNRGLFWPEDGRPAGKAVVTMLARAIYAAVGPPIVIPPTYDGGEDLAVKNARLLPGANSASLQIALENHRASRAQRPAPAGPVAPIDDSRLPPEEQERRFRADVELSFSRDSSGKLSETGGILGAYQYMGPGASRWGKAEAGRLAAPGNMVSDATSFLRRVAEDTGKIVPKGTAVGELGVGTKVAFENKTRHFIEALDAKEFAFMDGSTEFLEQVGDAAAAVPGLELITPFLGDIFKKNAPILKKLSVILNNGTTIGNIGFPISDVLPYVPGTDAMSNMASAATDGWFGVEFDSINVGGIDSEAIRTDGAEIVKYFEEYPEFQLGVLERIKDELVTGGDFDLAAFKYKAKWNPVSGQVAHIAVVLRDMHFNIGDKAFVLFKGEELHLKNSYKFSVKFVIECAERAGLEVVKIWSNGSTGRFILFRRKPASSAGQTVH